MWFYSGQKEELKKQEKLWNDYFLILETLEEKQVHIVKQITPKIASLTAKSSFNPDESRPIYGKWILIVWKRLFGHQNFAVVKWSLKTFMSENRVENGDFVVATMLENLNNYNLFHGQQKTDEIRLEPFLSQFRGNSGEFWNELLMKSCEISWSPIPLYHLTKAVFASIPENEHLLSEKTLRRMCSFSKDVIRCQEPLLKCASQHFLLKIILKSGQFNVKWIKNFAEILIYGSKVWEETKNRVEKLNSDFDRIECEFGDDCELMAFLVLMIKPGYVKRLIEEIIDKEDRPYALESVMRNVKILVQIWELRRGPKRRKGRANVLEYGIDDLPSLRNNDLDLLQGFDRRKVFNIAMNAFLAEKCQNERILSGILSICKVNKFEWVKSFRNQIEEIFWLEISLRIEDFEEEIENLEVEDDCKILVKRLKIACKFPSPIFQNSNFMDTAVKIADIGNVDCLVEILKLVKISFTNSNSEKILVEDRLCEFFTKAKVSTFELRKNDNFWPSFDALVDALFCDELLKLKSDKIQNLQSNLLSEFLDEAELVKSVAAILSSRFHDFCSENENLVIFPRCISDNLGKLASFGPPKRKDHKILDEANLSVIGLGPEIAANFVEGSDHGVDLLVRSHAQKLLLRFSRNCEFQTEIIRRLLSYEEEEICGGDKKRYFDNSQIHLKKNRILAAILILIPDLTGESTEMAFEKALSGINAESVQWSIRYLCEWIIMKIALKDAKFLRLIENSYEKARVDKLNSIPSYLTILSNYHLITGTGINDWMDRMIPWTMSHHFNTRSTAQMLFMKLYARNGDKTRHELVFQSIKEAIYNHGKKNSANKLKEDFYLTDFDPDLCFTLEDIIKHLPRLCGVTETEWTHFEAIYAKVDFRGLIRAESESGLKSRETPRPKGCESGCDFETNDGSANVIQKKITPWTGMLTQEMTQVKSQPKHPDLVLVASLIDRLPNLGGLCRTSEILGVGQFVLGNKSVVAETEFRNLSVTAHQWVTIKEVAPENIGSFLDEKRRSGFSIIAVEQTSDSKILGQFEFPRKSVLLLGNEREGIPVDLIGKVDACLEIPQSGLIRSFNVHVTGAIVLWEYFRQFL